MKPWPLILAMMLVAAPVHAQVEEAGIASLSAAGRTTSEKAVRAYLKRIAVLDRKGPRLNSIIALNPRAVAEARALVSFIGPAYAEQRLLDAGHAYEQAAGVRTKPDFRPTVDSGPELEGPRS